MTVSSRGHRGRLLLCTDLDRTLLPNGAQPESPRAREAFRRLATQPDIVLVYVSGRDRALIERAIVNYALPRPALAVGDVGTSIYDLRDGDWRSVDAWQAEIAPDWCGYDRPGLANVIGEFSILRLQEQSKQNTYKLSYYVPLHADRQALDRIIAERLGAIGVEASLVWSVDEPAGVGLLDVLPRSATKLHAVQFVRALLDVPIGHTVFAGDSGNDLPVLVSEIPSVLVANAMPEVREEACRLARASSSCEALYVASGRLTGMNGNYAAGIIEGVLHYHPRLAASLDDFLDAG
ncbi:MAG: HAD-IIB family hydrolase [Gammaproteobacteria bacterium]|nr:HAD-IIB family hydrolase [Gammaproteobacteria bacterium]